MNPFRSLARTFARKPQPAATIRKVKTKPKTRLVLDTFEDRLVPAGLDIRSIDGTGNNITNPNWGVPGASFIRVAPAAYTDGISTPSGASRPSAREISNAVADQGDTDVISDRFLSAMMYAWGQFIDHDIDSTPTGTTESFNIAVPTGDPYFDPAGTGTKTISMKRSVVATGTGTSTANPRQQVNNITAWMDGSMVYGSDTATANSLRTMQGGKMKTSANNLLPTDAAGFFQAGDARVNENPELTSLQTLFVREHNRKAAEIARANPSLSDEQIYQQARAWVIAEIQVITYKEWLPTLLGGDGVGAYRGYDPRANPAISNEFATAGFRMGHSMLGDDIEFLANDGTEVREGVSLANAFFNPSLVRENNIDPILKYLASDPSSEIDTKVVGSVRNFLFGAPGSGGFDLASLNIQRGRDHGLADYNTTRAAYGLPKITSFSQITSDTTVAGKLQQLYGNVNNIDLWVGVLAEKHVQGGSVGPTAKAIISEQFGRLRAADRFWYQRSFSGANLQQLENTTLASLIQRNTNLTTIQQNAFVFNTEIKGSIFGDTNRDGRLNGPEQNLAGRTVQLIDVDSGEVLAQKKTGPRGEFAFNVLDGIRTGKYKVQLVLNVGENITTPPAPVITITTGNQNTPKINIGVARSANAGTTPIMPPMMQPPAPPRTRMSANMNAMQDPFVMMGAFVGGF